MKISIIIPNYNYENYIGETIKSILNQNYSNFEIIVVDDGSMDNSVNVIKKFQNSNPEKSIKLICQENKGQANAVNAGLSLSSGDIIGWINSDDTYCDDAFLNVIKYFTNNQIDVLYGDINVIDLNGIFIHSLEHFRFSYFISTFTGFANNMSNNAVFWRKDSFIDTIYLNPNFKCALDSELFSRLTFKKKVKHIKTKLANFRLQKVSKAAIKNVHWNDLMRKEDELVFNQAYKNLLINNFISSKTAIKLKPLFILFQRLLKVFTGRFFKNIYEKLKYSFTSQARTQN